MNLKNLTYFLALSEADSYSRAAESLGISKSTLSHAISKLEEELNAQLISRDRGGFSLTDDGRALLEPARHVLESAQELPNVLKRRQTPIIRIGVPRRCFSTPLLRLIQGFQGHVTNVCRFDIVQDTYMHLPETTRARRVDFGFCNKRVGVEMGEGLEACVIAPSPLFCILSTKSPLATCDSLTLRDIAPYTVAPLDGVQLQHIRRFNAVSDVHLTCESSSMSILSASLAVAMGSHVALDYMDWSQTYPGLIAVPVRAGETRAADYLCSDTVLFRAPHDEAPQAHSPVVVEAFWNYAQEVSSQR